MSANWNRYNAGFWALLGSITGVWLARLASFSSARSSAEQTQWEMVESGRLGSLEDAKSKKKDHGTAYWGLLGSLIGGLIAGGTTFATAYFTANRAEDQARVQFENSVEQQTRQFEATNDQERVEFLRTERLEIYKAGMTDSQVFMIDVSRWAALSEDTPGPVELSSAAGQAHDSYRRAVASAWGVRLSAPENVEDVNQRVSNILDCSYSVFDGTLERDLGEVDEVAELEKASKRVNDLVTQFAKHAAREFEPGTVPPAALEEDTHGGLCSARG